MNGYIENRQVIGEYPSNVEDVMIYCPHCKERWYGYFTDDDEVEWESDSGREALVTDVYSDPTGNGRCPICAWKDRTINEEFAFIEDNGYQNRVMGYALCEGGAYSRFHKDSVEELWEILKQSAFSWLAELVEDFVSDVMRDEFVSYILGID